jgi:hypothetical protein
MHPPRPKTVAERTGFADHITDWLLVHCPFTAITLLTLLVVAPTLGVPRPVVILAAVICADLVLNLVRRARRVRKSEPPTAMGPRATA